MIIQKLSISSATPHEIDVRFPPVADIRNWAENALMHDPKSLVAFARGLHQDVMIGLSSERDLARALLSGLTPAEKQGLRDWLSVALEKLTAAEMKGLLNRASTDTRFSAKEAFGLLRAASDELGLP